MRTCQLTDGELLYDAHTVERQSNRRQRRHSLQSHLNQYRDGAPMNITDTYVVRRYLRDHDERNGANADSERPARQDVVGEDKVGIKALE